MNPRPDAIITEPQSGIVVHSGALTVRGHAMPHANVRVYDWLTAVGETTADDVGSWSLSISLRLDGKHALRAAAADPTSGELSTSDPCWVTFVLEISDERHRGQLPHPGLRMPAAGVDLSGALRTGRTFFHRMHATSNQDSADVETSNTPLANVAIIVNGVQAAESWEHVLRSLGRYLDEVRATSTRCIGLPGQVLIQYHDAVRTIGAMDVMPSLQALHSQSDHLRTLGRMTHPLRGAPIIRYAELLAAVGYEVDRTGASTILFEEVGSGFLLTYHSFPPTNHYLLTKNMVLADETTKQMMLHAARDRLKKRRFSSV